MGRRRKKYKRIIKKVRRIPSVFQCPHCGSRSLTVELKRDEETLGRYAIIRCGNCGLRAIMEDVPEIYETVDVYGKFIDAFAEGGSDKIKIEFVKVGEEEGEMGPPEAGEGVESS